MPAANDSYGGSCCRRATAQPRRLLPNKSKRQESLSYGSGLDSCSHLAAAGARRGTACPPEFLHPRPHLLQKRFRSPPVLESQHDVIGLADHNQVPSRPRPPPLVHPE